MAKKEVKGPEKGALDMLLENSIALQKTLAGLAADLKVLNKKVSSMLELFESASKVIREKPKAPAAIPTELLEKIDLLTKQNKTIAKGLLLLERAIREKEERPAPATKPLPEL